MLYGQLDLGSALGSSVDLSSKACSATLLHFVSFPPCPCSAHPHCHHSPALFCPFGMGPKRNVLRTNKIAFTCPALQIASMLSFGNLRYKEQCHKPLVFFICPSAVAVPCGLPGAASSSMIPSAAQEELWHLAPSLGIESLSHFSTILLSHWQFWPLVHTQPLPYKPSYMQSCWPFQPVWLGTLVICQCATGVLGEGSFISRAIGRC